jgi:hypothetical protein
LLPSINHPRLLFMVCGVTHRARIASSSASRKRMRHDSCGGIAGKAELLTGIEGASSRPVRRIVLLDG